MPKAIIDVEVDPQGKFKAFQEAFAKYKEQLDSTPSAWAAVGEKTSEIGAGFAAMTAALLAELELIREQDAARQKQAKAEQDAAKKKTDAQKAQDKADKDRAARSKKAVEDTKKIAANIAGATKDVLKWATFDLVGGAAGLWGLGRLVGSVGAERRQAQGLGVSTGERQAMQVNLQRYFDVNSNLESIANAQQDVTQWANFARMGVNPQGKDPAQLAMEMALRVHSLYQQDHGNWTLGQAQGVNNFYTQDEWRRIGTTDLKDLRQSIKDTTKDIKLFGLSDKNSKSWQDFMVKVDEAGWTLKNKFVEKLSALNANGALDKFIAGFESLALEVFDRIDFKAIGIQFDKWAVDIKNIDFDKLGHKIDDVIKGFGDLVSWVGGVLQKLGIIQDPHDKPLTWDQASKVATAFDVDTRPKTVAKEMAAMKFFESQGWTPAQSAGIVANLYRESGINPNVSGDKDKHGVYQAYGLAQWHPDRQAEYAKLFGHTMQSVTDRAQAYKEQLQFIQYELTKGARKYAGDDLKSANNAADAASYFTYDYEAPKDAKGDGTKRAAAAEVLLTISNQTGANVATSANAAAR